jgi:hypothetical protein
MRESRTRARSPIGLAIVGLLSASICGAQPAPQPAAPPAQSAAPSSTTEAPPSSLDALAWLRGCWIGSVNQREFLEQWSPPRGGMMVGFSHTVILGPAGTKEKAEPARKMNANPSKAKTQDFEYLRLEQRDDGIYYVAVPSGTRELSFRLTNFVEQSDAKIFTFTNTVDEFPQRLVYRRGTEGWLYAQVMGKPGKAGSDVIYPMRHVDCATDALLKE